MTRVPFTPYVLGNTICLMMQSTIRRRKPGFRGSAGGYAVADQASRTLAVPWPPRFMRISLNKRFILKKLWPCYLLMFPALTYFVLFHYVPMYGIIIAFKDYTMSEGILGSKWVGFTHFSLMLRLPSFGEITRNTVLISLYRLVFGFPCPIILALFLNELRNVRLKKALQTISYLPHFLSWVVLAGFVKQMLSPTRGIVNAIVVSLGGTPINFLASPVYFRSILIVSGVWQSVGWGSIVYLSAISTINPELYECASMEGAGRIRKMWHITIPSIIPVISILLILQIGRIMNAGFDQIFNLYNPSVYRVADIIDT